MDKTQVRRKKGFIGNLKYARWIIQLGINKFRLAEELRNDRMGALLWPLIIWFAAQ